MQRIGRSRVTFSRRGLRALLLPVLAYLALPLPAAPQGTPAPIGESARPQRLRYVQDFPLGVAVTGSYSVPVTIPKFDTALGTLLCVDVKLTGNAYETIGWENLSQTPATGTMWFGCEFRFVGAAGSQPPTFGSNNSVAQTDIRALAPFDGVLDGAGQSGITFSYALSTSKTLHVDQMPSLALYQTSTSNTSYGLDLQPIWSYSGSAVYSTGIPGVLGSVFLTPTTVSARLEIVYTYQ